MSVLALLRSRNRCLGRLIEKSMAFLPQARNGDFSGLSPFVSGREPALKALRLFERDLAGMDVAEMKKQLEDDLARRQAAELVGLGEEMRSKLKELDSELAALIEKEQIATLKDISKSRAFSQTVSKFKSGGEPK
jgi:hypothetical protein